MMQGQQNVKIRKKKMEWVGYSEMSVNSSLDTWRHISEEIIIQVGYYREV